MEKVILKFRFKVRGKVKHCDVSAMLKEIFQLDGRPLREWLPLLKPEHRLIFRRAVLGSGLIRKGEKYDWILLQSEEAGGIVTFREKPEVREVANQLHNDGYIE